MNKFKAVLALLLAAMLALPPAGAQAAVLWNESSLAEVYNPSGDRYAYAPSVIQDGDTAHMWTCHNDADGVIKDHIYYTRITDGIVAESHSVLQAGLAGTWDSYHVCDPSVIAGEFQWNGATYSYAMFYLGNDVDASYHNQIGVAFATSPGGPWTKYPDPIIAYPNDGYWGVGQPAATSIDGQGRLLLFFTQGDPSATGGYRIELDLHDMASPMIGAKVAVTSNGLLDSAGNPDWLNNYDIAYNPANDRFVMVRELHPYPASHPNYISTAIQVASIEGAAIWGGGGQWKVEGTLGSAITGFARNHNPGLLRTAHGTLPHADAVTVYFTDSEAGDGLSGPPEYTYDIWRIDAELTAGNNVLEKELTRFGKGKQIGVQRLAHDLNTNVFSLHGIIHDFKPGHGAASDALWIGYRIYDLRGYLLEAGTAYRDAIAEDGAFAIPIAKPATAGSGNVWLEVQLLSAKGKPLETRRGIMSFAF